MLTSFACSETNIAYHACTSTNHIINATAVYSGNLLT